MTTWDTAYLVQRFKDEAGLQAASEYDDNADICPRLSRAQNKVMRLIASRYAKALYQAPITMTPSVDRKTFTFGNDAQGNPIMPLGFVQIATTLTAFSGDMCFSGWQEDRDFLDEATQIRIPSNRSYGGTLYARFVPTAPDLVATGTPVAPILAPADARNLIVIQAVMDWAGEGNQRPDIKQVMKQSWSDEFPSWMLVYKRRYRNGGGVLNPGLWYLQSPDLGSTGS
jgi:hypothetical protein